ncbi:MAG: hypothetical protein K0U93_14475 [Gammaproteobacteria bacterium]|nr:hypothetical protein [Gammaproteobacteria bacterium]
MSVFIDLHQNKRISEAAREASRASNKSERVDGRMGQIEQRVDRLALAAQALWELLRDSTSLTEADVFMKMEEVDLRDGKLDGKIGKEVSQCPGCQRNVSSKRTSCVYCGVRIQGKHIVS